MQFVTVRALLVTSSLLCFLCGFLMVTGGVIRYHETDSRLPPDWNGILATESLLVIKLGAVCLLVVVFGMYGTAKRSVRMMFTYRLLLALLIVIQIVMLLVGSRWDFRYLALERFREAFQRSVDRSRDFGVVDARIERLQSSYGCCGIDSYRDWGLVLPGSCYQSRSILVTGCVKVLERYLKESGRALGWLLMSMTFFEFFSLLFAKCYSNGIQSQLLAFVR